MSKILKLSPLLGGLVAIAVLTLVLIVYNLIRPVPMVGVKHILIHVVYEDGTKDSYKVTTEAQFLLEAINSISNLEITGITSAEYGFIVTTVNGITADYQKDNAYWEILLDGEPCDYTMNDQPIKDEETYTLQYTTVKEEVTQS